MTCLFRFCIAQVLHSLRLAPCELATSLGYHRRLNRGVPAVESSASGARRMMFISPDVPRGRYRGFGAYVTEDRHVSPGGCHLGYLPKAKP
jgi:hypothetical protein